MPNIVDGAPFNIVIDRQLGRASEFVNGHGKSIFQLKKRHFETVVMVGTVKFISKIMAF